MAVTASQFIQNLEASGLLEADDLSAARAQAKNPDLDGQALAVQLVQARKLTPYQAKQLLAGNTRGFFLEKYKILEPVGRGGMGLVFKAEHTMLARVAAIKVLPRKAASDREAVARFRREARATAQLEHENIVRVYDVGQQGEAHFIAMELVQGQSLSKVIRSRGKLSVRESVSIIYQVAQGLDHAFCRGITHRDIKPSNILITPEGKAKILDMGLARVFGLTAEEGASQLSLTMSGTVVGTVDYVAPEQADDSHKADVRSDIYSLGCTLYECITGRVPFPGGTMMQKLMKHYRAKPTEISELTTDVPKGLISVVKRMMAKRAADRFQRPSEVAAALLPFLTHGSADQSAGPTFVVPIAPPADRGDANALADDARLAMRRDIENTPDVSQHTMPTIPLGTPKPTKESAAITPSRRTVAEAAGSRADTSETSLASADTNKEATKPRPMTDVSGRSEKRQLSPPPANAASFDTSARIPASPLRSSKMKASGRRTEDPGVNEILEAIAVAASESPPSAAAEPLPLFFWTRTHTIMAAAAIALVIFASSSYYWLTSRPGTLVVQYPSAYASDLTSVSETKSGRILVDGRPLPITKHVRQEFRLKAGAHKLVVELPELNRVNEVISISSGKPVIVELTPTAEKLRGWELKDLTKRGVGELHKDPGDSDVARLLGELKAFATTHRGTEEAMDALALRGRLPWPADRLTEVKSPARLLTVVNTPNSQRLGVTLVATLETDPSDSSPEANCVSFSADGRYLACGRTNGQVQLWEVSGATNFRTLGDHGNPVVLTAFSSDSLSLTSVSVGKIVFWDVLTGAPRTKMDSMKGQLTAAAQSSDGRTLGCAFQEGFVSLYDVATGLERTQLSGFASAGQSLAISSTGKMLAFGGKEKVELWDIPKAKSFGNVKNSPAIVALGFSEDDQWLSMVNKDGAAKVWKLWATQFSVSAERDCSLLAFSPAVRTVAAVIEGRTIRLIQTASGETRGTLELDPSIGAVHQLVFAPDGRHLAIADSKGAVHVLRIDGLLVSAPHKQNSG